MMASASGCSRSRCSTLAVAVVMLSVLCVGVSSQGHVQETIGQTLQGESFKSRHATAHLPSFGYFFLPACEAGSALRASESWMENAVLSNAGR